MARFGRRHPIQAIIKRNNVAAPVVPGAAPVPPPLVNRIVSVLESSRRHAVSRGRIFLGNPFAHPGAAPFPAPEAIRVQLTYVHEVDDDNPRTRKALQQLTDTNNGLLRSGELKINGRFSDPYLGYVPESTVNWGGVEPDSIREALDRLAAGSATIPGVSGVTPLVTSATLSDTINKVNELLAALGS